MTIANRIGLRQVRALKSGETIWDASLSGFGARRQKSDAVAYVLYYRTGEGRQRWYTIGRHGAPWTPEAAREEAKRLLGDVAHKADPAAEKRAKRNAKTIEELCDLYLGDAETGRLVTRRRAPKKASTLATDRGRIERHIKPLLGRRTVAAVTREDIEAFMHDVAEGKTAGKTKRPKNEAWRMYAAAKVQRAAQWGCWARSSAMRCGIGCVPTIPCMVSCVPLTADVSDDLPMSNTRRSARH